MWITHWDQEYSQVVKLHWSPDTMQRPISAVFERIRKTGPKPDRDGKQGAFSAQMIRGTGIFIVAFIQPFSSQKSWCQLGTRMRFDCWRNARFGVLWFQINILLKRKPLKEGVSLSLRKDQLTFPSCVTKFRPIESELTTYWLMLHQVLLTMKLGYASHRK